MPRLDDEFAELAREHDFELNGEDIEYTPRGGSAREIEAVIDRQPRTQAGGELKRGIARFAKVQVRNSATTGIALSEINVEGDTVSIPETYPGQSPLVEKPIRRVLDEESNGAYTVIEV